MPTDISLIYLSEHGALVFCPTTLRAYAPQDARWRTFGAQTCLHSVCPFCDTHARTGTAYDASEPQPHVHSIGGRS